MFLPIRIEDGPYFHGELINTRTQGFIPNIIEAELPVDILNPFRTQPKKMSITLEFYDNDAEQVYGIISSMLAVQKKG